MATKEKIINAAIELFNDQGFANVRLQNIADRVGISVGNLAYHFKNKEAIVNQAYEIIGDELKEILSRFRSQPSLLDLEEQLNGFHSFIHQFKFYFIDILEIKRQYPHLHEQRQEFIKRMIIQIRKRFDYNVKRGILVPESFPGQYDLTANNIWMIITFWISQNMIKGNGQCNKGAFKASIWIQITPFLTRKGFKEYQHLVLSRY